MKWKTIGDVSGFIVALAALVLGFVHVREIRSTARDLASVKASISTQFSGGFPAFIDDVIATVESAQHDLVIVCDFPSFADYSDPRRALILRQTIERKLHRGVRVQLICLNAKRRLAILHNEFKRVDFEKNLSTPQGRQLLSRYIGVPVTKPLTYDAFIDGSNENDEIALRQTFRNASILQVDAVPIFFWIADSAHGYSPHGVMVIQTFAGEQEYGFKTSDPELINALLATRDQYTHEMSSQVRGN